MKNIFAKYFTFNIASTDPPNLNLPLSTPRKTP